jgi:hypothetical protein
MSMLKKGFVASPIIISNMVFVCNSCNHVEIISDKDFVPNTDRKCQKCQTIMVLSSTNTNTIKVCRDGRVEGVEGVEDNVEITNDKPTKE